jgi:hypothetical protein
MVTDGSFFRVHAAQSYVVAGITADGVAGGEPRVKVEHLAKLDFRRRGRISGQGRSWRAIRISTDAAVSAARYVSSIRSIRLGGRSDRWM